MKVWISLEDQNTMSDPPSALRAAPISWTKCPVASGSPFHSSSSAPDGSWVWTRFRAPIQSWSRVKLMSGV